MASLDPVYDQIGQGYAQIRCADPRIAARIESALGEAETVVNVGAGAGSYEPEDRWVLAIEPSQVMRAQRPAHLPPAIPGIAEQLPLDDGAVDAAMAVFTIHHWSDPVAGLRELRRVVRQQVVILTVDAMAVADAWLQADYLPEVYHDDVLRFPPIEQLVDVLGGARVEVVPIPSDCTDGFFHAYYSRPEAYLDPAVRAAQSVWPPLPMGVEERAVDALRRDLASGAWDARHGHLRQTTEYDMGLRLVVADP